MHVFVCFFFVLNKPFSDSLYCLADGKAKKKICVFPIVWSEKLGSVGRDIFFFFFL